MALHESKNINITYFTVQWLAFEVLNKIDIKNNIQKTCEILEKIVKKN